MLRSSEAARGALPDATTQNTLAEKTGRTAALARLFPLRRLRGGLLFAVGYLLSPLCWWNDLIVNLPVAYGVGYLCSLVSVEGMLPGLIGGYWLSNVLGFVLMQFGAVDALQNQTEAKPRNPHKELFIGVASSTVYTLVILALMQFHIINPTSLLPQELLNLLPS
jgi:hypothetical protein